MIMHMQATILRIVALSSSDSTGTLVTRRLLDLNAKDRSGGLLNAT